MPELIDDLGKVIAKQTQRIMTEQGVAWERTLRLHIRPKPAWCPDNIWQKVVEMVLIQSDQR